MLQELLVKLEVSNNTMLEICRNQQPGNVSVPVSHLTMLSMVETRYSICVSTCGCPLSTSCYKLNVSASFYYATVLYKVFNYRFMYDIMHSRSIWA